MSDAPASGSVQVTARTVLVTGGARSGKSLYAEGLVNAAQRERIYVATCTPFDDEMRQRIDRHRDQRGEGWRTIEEPRDLAGVIAAESTEGRAILVDCLTLWLSNLMLNDHDPKPATERLVASLAAREGTTVLVSNEVGFGIVPENALARRLYVPMDRARRALLRICILDEELTKCEYKFPHISQFPQNVPQMLMVHCSARRARFAAT